MWINYVMLFAREVANDKWYIRIIRRNLAKYLFELNPYLGNDLQLIDSRVRLIALWRCRDGALCDNS